MKSQSTVRLVFIVFLEAILILTLLAAVVWIPAQKVFLQPEVYQQALADQGLYQYVPSLVSGYLSGDSSKAIVGDQLAAITSRLDQTQWNQFILDVISPEWLRGQVEKNVDRVFDLLGGESDSLNISLDLSGIKTTLSSDASIQNMLRLLPACSASDLTKLLNLLNGSTDIPFCRFPDNIMDAIYPAVKPLILSTMEGIPSQLPVFSYTYNDEGSIFPLSIFSFTRNVRLINTVLIVFLVIEFVGLILISKPGKKPKVRNPGLALFIAGFIALFLDLLFWAAANTSLIGIAQSRLSIFPEEFSKILANIFLQVANSYAVIEAIAALLILTLGVALFIISRTLIKD